MDVDQVLRVENGDLPVGDGSLGGIDGILAVGDGDLTDVDQVLAVDGGGPYSWRSVEDGAPTEVDQGLAVKDGGLTVGDGSLAGVAVVLAF